MSRVCVLSTVLCLASSGAFDGQSSGGRFDTRGSGRVVTELPAALQSSAASDSLVVSPASFRVAYVDRADGREFVVVDGQPGAHYSKILRGPTFAPDGTRVAYVARQLTRGGPKAVVVDTTQEAARRYDEIVDGPVFSPDSRRIAYVARIGRAELVVVDGTETKRYGNITSAPIFSADSRRLAWTAQVPGGEMVIVDGVEGTPYDAIFTFAGNGGGRIVFDGPDQFHYLARTGNRVVLVREGLR